MFIPHDLSPFQFTAANAFTYLQSIHIVSTTFAIWGLVILQTAFRADLVRYVSGLKFLFLQLTLIGTSLLNIIIGSLVSKGIIPCTPFLPSTARAASKYTVLDPIRVCHHAHAWNCFYDDDDDGDDDDHDGDDDDDDDDDKSILDSDNIW